ncbi:MAG TPA: prepilin-type N-terminal cleavage/methylation domain-containing protein [Candidatus Paceibacterota bacterium]
MKKQGIGNRLQGIVNAMRSRFCYNLPARTCQFGTGGQPTTYNLPRERGFTLVETLLAVSLLCVAITAPMLLTVQALSSAYYARDQITAYHLAQEGIEAIHAVRDGQILAIALTSSEEASGIDLFGALEEFADGDPFIIDITDVVQGGAIEACSSEPCRSLQTNSDAGGTLYGYESGWTPTIFTRTLTVCYVQPPPSEDCNSNETDEIQITSSVSWRTGSFQPRTFTISENLYRWIQDGSGV